MRRITSNDSSGACDYRIHLRYVHERRRNRREAIEPPGGITVSLAAFRQGLAKWRKQQRKHMPALFQASVEDEDDDAWAIGLGIVDDDDDDDDDEEEEEPGFAEMLGLPSDFSHEDRIEYDLEVLADYELSIRIGMAFDYLDAVRLAVQHRASLLEYKKQNARTTKTNTHAQGEIDKAREVARVMAVRYNDNYERIVSLRAPDYDARADDTAGARLRSIDYDSDLAIANMARARTLGDSKVTPSWIWSVFESSEKPSMRSNRRKESAATYTSGKPARRIRMG